VRKRALVVDSDRLCELLGDILSQEGYQACKAFDGMEAGGLAGDLLDIVFLDLVMPKIDGDSRVPLHPKPSSTCTSPS
jgi:DNA-binding response OmpR family regulator